MTTKLEQFFIEKGSSKSTQKHYNAAIRLYEKLTGLTIDELLLEAEREEEEKISWKKRTLKKRLIEFRNYLYANKGAGTVGTYFGDVKTIYRHYEIELHPLPSFNSKQIDKVYEKKFEDILTKSELVDAYYEANNVGKCIILFGISSGLSKVDLLNLTVGSFIAACSDYITAKELPDQLEELKNQTVIPCFEGARQKTGTSYTTFCSPEAAEHIVHYLQGRDANIRREYEAATDKSGLAKKLELDDKLFKISANRLTVNFRKINNKLGLGKVSKATKFRCHQLRAYQASTLLNCECGEFSESEIDTLQGRKRSKTHRAYLVDSRSKLFKKYEKCVDELQLFKSLHGVDKEAYQRLENENKEFKEKIEVQQQEIEEIRIIQAKLEKLVGL